MSVDILEARADLQRVTSLAGSDSLPEPAVTRDWLARNAHRVPGVLRLRRRSRPAGAGLALRTTLKRAVDVAGAAGLLLFLAPLMLGTAVAIRASSPGPVLFAQTRVGRHGLGFRLYKFRTMHADRCDPSGVAQTRAGDERVTRLGRMLRMTNLDELPQLFNILRGDMSFVGPRPHVPGQVACGEPYARLVPEYVRRHQVRPGLTGLAQSNGFRGPTDSYDAAVGRVAFDLLYVEHFALRLDARILWWTLRNEVVRGTGF